jgi:hypothetical protein
VGGQASKKGGAVQRPPPLQKYKPFSIVNDTKIKIKKRPQGPWAGPD